MKWGGQLKGTGAAGRCILAYSDLPHSTVMAIASRAMAAGADFGLLSPQRSYIKSKKPVRASPSPPCSCQPSLMPVSLPGCPCDAWTATCPVGS